MQNTEIRLSLFMNRYCNHQAGSVWRSLQWQNEGTPELQPLTDLGSADGHSWSGEVLDVSEDVRRQSSD